MRFLRPLLLTGALACCAATAHAQSVRPATLDLAAAPLASVERVQLPAPDNDALVARDRARALDGTARPLRFAEPTDITLRPETHGTWETLADGRRVWRLRISSPGAYSLNVGFSRFRLPDGAALWLYPAGEEPAFRAFTAADNEAHGQLWTPIVPGDDLVLELDLPAAKPGDEPAFELEVLRVGHAYRPFGIARSAWDEAAQARSGSCNVDVVCPEGDGFRDIIRSVGAYTLNGFDTCSGSAMNNTLEDGKPLFLTADHCGVRAGNAASMVIYWNYENSTCRPPGSSSSGNNGDGSREQFSSGATLLGTSGGGTSGGPDWTVVETDDPIPPAFNVYLNGWDRRDRGTASAIAIHHPGVEEKRISFENDPTNIDSYLGRPGNPSGTHLRVDDWDLGTTEGGSSGSPLFSPEKRVIGQLSGGFASCTSQTEDWYGRMARNMTTGAEAFLDPAGTGAPFIDGKEAGVGAFGTFAADPASTTPGSTVRLTATFTNATGGDLSGVTFEDDLAAGLTYAGNPSSSAGSVSQSGGTVTWTFDLADGGNATVAYDVALGTSVDGDITNLATFDHPSLDNPATVAVTIDVFVEADLIYTNAQTVSIPDNACPSNVTSAITVPDAFAWDQLKVGVTISHTYRGDLRLELESPAGTTVELLQRVGGTSNNLDALFSDEGPSGAFGSGNHDLGLPSYEVEGRPQGTGTSPLSSFIGEDPQGTWTLSVCDDAGIDTGSLEQWSLLFFTPNTPADLALTLVPDSEPVVVGPEGGTFGFAATLASEGDAPATFDAWAVAELPNGETFGPVFGPVSVTLNAGAAVTRALTQDVPGTAPSGEYLYVGYVGDYPDGAVASDGFAVVKSATQRGDGPAVEAWAARYADTGSPVEVGDRWTDEPALTATAPDGFALGAVYPNPMRDQAAVRVQLEQAAVTTVSVYDLLGRRVAVLHRGELPAGETTLRFDRAGLADGTYLVRAETAAGVATQRVTVLR
ncbi:MAG: proprotein convertase P-domain-containing protein [Bacteroidota bacterium]